MGILRLSHIGICVSDLERSQRFYCDLLGFRADSRLRVEGEPSQTLLGLDEVDLQAVYLERDGTFIELLYFAKPGSVGGAGPRPVNQLGLTHLSLRVDDFEATVEKLTEAGVEFLTSTRIENRSFGAHAVFLTDPDGLRIELYQAPGDPSRPPGM